MCSTCGCSDDAGTRISRIDLDTSIGSEAGGLPHLHDHEHLHNHEHHDHEHHEHHEHHDHAAESTTISLEQSLLARNDLEAARNRGWLEGRKIFALNLMSSPGAGKTTLLVRTINEMAGHFESFVIEGDQETTFDAERIRATGSTVVQVNTGAGCHLDASMVHRALDSLDPSPRSTVFIENVGNLVCPALFDLGEAAKVVIVSVTEGDDKPEKYPHMFLAADLLIVNKADLLPYVEFDVERFLERARRLNPHVEAIVVSATTGEGLTSWFDWLTQKSGASGENAAAGIPEHSVHA
ncbi:hydrogenase nickel incorporation protein HypB [Sinomonas terrae]|uniref:Hydrogenase nickel incorporation protein HypB n=1 Tax=Sinomonas terrae TaxID=2908838 RepID=A0ABS9TVY3_9MICC|nr:hydrogenase nickel incorporation protein HypB [Sinomonas terrae]MCH6468577.1 hydrogenase nickel incorporation protein HypB [Sinomonas terrae]